MECRESQTLLTAFHDGELPAADRARVADHLRGCPDCAALLAALARVDRAAGVPDPGPGYWDRFNARVMDRVERSADGPKAAVLRPKGGWVRQQLRYLVPAAAAAALVVGIIRYSGTHPGAPTPPPPPAMKEPAAPGSEAQRMAKAEPGSRGTKTAGSTGVAPRVPPPVPASERSAAVTREERDRPADRSLSSGNEEASRDRAAAPAGVSVPSPPPVTYRGTLAGSPPVPTANGMTQGREAERKKMEGAAAPMAEPQGGGKAAPASGTWVAKETVPGSPCERARTLAERDRIREAEVAQRACLAGDLDAPSREKGLVFLAELLDRQERFAEADAVIADVDRRFPQSRPLDLYRQQRPIVQRQPKAVPVTR